MSKAVSRESLSGAETSPIDGYAILSALFGWRRYLAAVATLLAASLAIALLAFHIGDGQQHRARAPMLMRPPIVQEQRILNISPESAKVLNSKLPFVTQDLVPAKPFHAVTTSESFERARDCLAVAGWYEAGNDAVGQRAVMQVVLNRARHPAFPKTVCGVVFQGSERRTGCQFTFTCDGSLLHRTPGTVSLANARKVADSELRGKVDPDVGFATHYHADYVVPYWASALEKVAQVGPHLFYRWKGFWGTARAFNRKGGIGEPAFAALSRISSAHAVQGALAIADQSDPESSAAKSVQEPTALAAPLPPVLTVQGVREKSLRGALVRARPNDENAFFLQLDPATYPGNYATAAVALCKDRSPCIVLGWRQVDQMAQALPLTSKQRAELTFLFVQSDIGMDKAFWNCGQIPRSNPQQCLPADTSLAMLAGSVARSEM